MTPADGVDLEPSSGPPARGGRRRILDARGLQALTGLGLLGPYVVYHLVGQHLATLRAHIGGQADASRAGGAVLALLVAGGVLGHAVLGLRFATRARAAEATWRRPAGWSLAAQLATGIAVLAFVALHGWTVVGPALVGSFGPAQEHAWLVRLLSTSRVAVPVWGMVYVLGACAVAAHLGHGLWGSATAFGLASSRREQRRVALLCAVLALALAVVGSDAVVRLATGSGIDWPWAEPRAEAEEPTPGVCAPGSAATSASTAPAAGSSAAAPAVPPPATAPSP